MVTGAYFPEVSGGGLQCRTLALALRASIDFTILTTTTVASAPARDSVDGLPVYRVFVDPARRASRVRAALTMARLLPGLLRRTDVVHLHGFTRKMLLLVPLAKSMRIPVLAKMTSVGHDDPIALRARMGPLALRVFSMADRFVSISPAMTDRYLQSTLREDRLAFLPNGVDVERFRPVGPDERRDLRQTLGLPLDGVLVIFVGFWSREKAPDVLFDAWRQAAEGSGVTSALIFVGATAHHGEVEPGYVADLQARITRSGARVRQFERTLQIEHLLAAADIFALPSTREGLSNALLEAMATGLACVTAQIPGVTEWILPDADTGVTVPPGNVDALSRVLRILLLDDRARQKMGMRARAAAVERFSIQAVAGRYSDMYRDLSADRS
ncbi:MAG: glycosyltransferase family 4 protein [Acidobacteriota bacterium]